MKLLFLLLLSCLELAKTSKDTSQSSQTLTEDTDIAGKPAGTIFSSLPTKNPIDSPTNGPSEEVLEVIIEQDTMFTTSKTAHLKIKTNEPIKDSEYSPVNKIMLSMSQECLEKGCLLSLSGGNLIGPVGNKKYTYFLSITGPHGNPFVAPGVLIPAVPYTLELTIPAQSLESLSGLKNNDSIKIYIDYTQYSWNYRAE